MRIGAGLLTLATIVAPAQAKKPSHAAARAVAAPPRAISELAGKFTWDLSPDQSMKMVTDDIAAQFDEKIKNETVSAKQDELIRQREEAVAKVKNSYVKFDGQKTGWDVSIVDHEFAHKNGESMFVLLEKDQRRFLFFYNDRLWKQLIAFNAENPNFAGKKFDDFATVVQKRYGAAAATFRKKRTSDEQTLDHLEWAPMGDYLLWALDLTNFYGNFCLSLMKKSAVAEIERSRLLHSPRERSAGALVDQVTQGEAVAGDSNANIVDEITGRVTQKSDEHAAPRPAPAGGRPAAPKPAKSSTATPSEDPLEGLKF